MPDAQVDKSARLIVVGNEKGGSGKSTVAMHVAIALMKSNNRVGTIDLDSRQKTFTHYIENRFAWAEQINCKLEIPNHIYFVENMDHPTADEEVADGDALADQIKELASGNDFIVVDTPGRNSYLGRLVHAMADVLITPLNDSFIDLDVLGTVDRQALAVTGTSHYSQMVQEARLQRYARDNVNADWIVLRNRLSMLGSRNSKLVGQGLSELSRKLDFRHIDGLAERVIFKEFYPRGLTALDSLDATLLGTRPTLSHVTARMEINALMSAIGLRSGSSGGSVIQSERDAA
jgi:chromosome partitioning protein